MEADSKFEWSRYDSRTWYGVTPRVAAVVSDVSDVGTYAWGVFAHYGPVSYSLDSGFCSSLRAALQHAEEAAASAYANGIVRDAEDGARTPRGDEVWIIRKHQELLRARIPTAETNPTPHKAAYAKLHGPTIVFCGQTRLPRL